MIAKESSSNNCTYTQSPTVGKSNEDSKLNKVFQYKIEKDTLSISHFTSIDKKTGAISVPIERNIYNTEIKLIGKYHQ